MNSKSSATMLIVLLIMIGLVVGGIYFSSSPKTSTSQTSESAQEPADEKTVLGDERHSIGPADAKVTLVDFADFQCPYCALAHEQIKKLIAEYPDDLRVVYRIFPVHEAVWPASYVAELASEKGKFFQLQDLFYQNASDLSEEKIMELAEEVGLDKGAAQDTIKSEKYKNLIDQDVADGDTLDITGTPTIYLNNQQLKLQKIEDIKTAVEEALGQ